MTIISTNNEQLNFLYDDLKESSDHQQPINDETLDMVSIIKMLDDFSLEAPQSAVDKILAYSKQK